MAVMEVMEDPPVVPKPVHNRSAEAQDLMGMEVPAVARRLDHNLPTRVSLPLDPVENIPKYTNRAMGSAFESAPMNQRTEPRRSPKVKPGFGKAERNE